MANEKNIEKHRFTSDQSREEAAKNGKKGGVASGEARRRKKLFREAFEQLLSDEYHDTSGNVLDGTSVLAQRVFKRALDGDLKAFELVRDTVGQRPAERVETVEIPLETYEYVAAYLAGEVEQDDEHGDTV